MKPCRRTPIRLSSLAPPRETTDDERIDALELERSIVTNYTTLDGDRKAKARIKEIDAALKRLGAGARRSFTV